MRISEVFHPHSIGNLLFLLTGSQAVASLLTTRPPSPYSPSQTWWMAWHRPWASYINSLLTNDAESSSWTESASNLSQGVVSISSSSYSSLFTSWSYFPVCPSLPSAPLLVSLDLNGGNVPCHSLVIRTPLEIKFICESNWLVLRTPAPAHTQLCPIRLLWLNWNSIWVSLCRKFTKIVVPHRVAY